MNPIEIRKATVADLEMLQKLSIQTFTETFAVTNTPENIANYIDKSFNTEQLIRELNTIESQFYMAFSDTIPVGYLKVNFGEAQTEIIEGNSLEIHRIYVLQNFHGKKVGKLLLDTAKNIGQTSGVTSIWLGVWEENYRALRFYTKNGFVVFDQHDFIMGTDKQTDLMMQLIL
nr:N-acetyltransferase [Flavobacterium sp.]